MFLPMPLEIKTSRIRRVINAMKKMKIITLISLFAVLTACSEKSTVEKPSFSGYKNEVTFNEFYEALDKLSVKNAVFGAKLDSFVPSFESKGLTKINMETSYSRSGEAKTMSFYSSLKSSTIESQSSFDTAKKIYDYSSKKNYVLNEKYYNNEEITEIADTTKKSFHLENKDFEGEKHVAILNKNSHLLSDSSVEDENIDFVASIIATSSLYVDYDNIPSLVDWIGYTEIEKKNFKFYVDDNTLTVAMNKEISAEVKKLVVNDEKIISKTKKTETRTLQLVIDTNEVKYKDYIVSNEKYEHMDYSEEYISTDTRETKIIKSTDSYIKLSDKVSLNEENESSYREGREVISDLYFTYSDL